MSEQLSFIERETQRELGTFRINAYRKIQELEQKQNNVEGLEDQDILSIIKELTVAYPAIQQGLSIATKWIEKGELPKDLGPDVFRNPETQAIFGFCLLLNNFRKKESKKDTVHIQTEDRLVEEKALQAMMVRGSVGNNQSRIGFGRPGSWFYFDPKANLINIDLGFALLLGLQNSRAILLHEIGHSQITLGRTKRMKEIQEKIKSLVKEINEDINTTESVKGEKLAELAGLELEYSYRENFFQYAEDCAVNLYAEVEGKKTNQNVRISALRNYVVMGAARNTKDPTEVTTKLLKRAKNIDTTNILPPTLSTNPSTNPPPNPSPIPSGSDPTQPEDDPEKVIRVRLNAAGFGYPITRGLVNHDTPWDIIGSEKNEVTESLVSDLMSDPLGAASLQPLYQLSLVERLDSLEIDTKNKALFQARIEAFDSIFDKYFLDEIEKLKEKLKKEIPPGDIPVGQGPINPIPPQNEEEGKEPGKEINHTGGGGGGGGSKKGDQPSKETEEGEGGGKESDPKNKDENPEKDGEGNGQGKDQKKDPEKDGEGKEPKGNPDGDGKKKDEEKEGKDGDKKKKPEESKVVYENIDDVIQKGLQKQKEDRELAKQRELDAKGELESNLQEGMKASDASRSVFENLPTDCSTYEEAVEKCKPQIAQMTRILMSIAAHQKTEKPKVNTLLPDPKRGTASLNVSSLINRSIKEQSGERLTRDDRQHFRTNIKLEEPAITNLELYIDGSGSTYGEVSRRAIITAIIINEACKRIPEVRMFAHFSGGADTVTVMHPDMDQAHMEKLLGSILTTGCGRGSNEIDPEGLGIALKEIKEAKVPKKKKVGNTHFLFLTDGGVCAGMPEFTDMVRTIAQEDGLSFDMVITDGSTDSIAERALQKMDGLPAKKKPRIGHGKSGDAICKSIIDTFVHQIKSNKSMAPRNVEAFKQKMRQTESKMANIKL